MKLWPLGFHQIVWPNKIIHVLEQITLQWQNFWHFVGQTDVGNEEKGLRFKKIVLFWQNIWNSRKIAAEIKEKLPDHEGPFVEESSLYTFAYQRNENHAMDVST